MRAGATPFMIVFVAAPREYSAAALALSIDPVPSAPWSPPREAGNFQIVLTGIGKANAAGVAGRYLDPSRHAAVLSVGIAGALPTSKLELRSVVAATSSVYADEGLETPTGFVDCAAMGFPLGPFPGCAIPADPGLLARVRAVADVSGPIATVSTCSGTDVLASRVEARTGALAEAMEGAAIGQV